MPPILFISLRADHGGGPAHLWMLLSAVHRQGQPQPGRLAAVVACPREEPYWSRFTELLGDENVHQVPHRAFHVVAVWELMRLMRRRRIGLIHSHGKGAGIYARILSLLTGVPCVHTFHGLHLGRYNPVSRFGYLLLERILGRCTRALIAVSAGEARAWQENCHFPPHRMQVILNGVPAADVQLSSSAPTVFTVSCITRFDEQKNTEFTLEIVAAWSAIANGLVLHLVLIGDGPGRAAVQAAILARGLAGNIRCVGQQSAPRGLVAASDAYLSTSRWEGMPLAVIEAAMEGVPLVVSDVVGNRDVIDLVGGHVYQLGDAPAAARALWTIATDRPAARAAAERSRQAAERHFSVASMAAVTVRAYRVALESQHAALFSST